MPAKLFDAANKAATPVFSKGIAIGRSILGVFCGGLAGFVLNMAIVMLCSVIFPLPPGMDYSDTEAMKAFIQTLPLSAFLLVLLAHQGGTLAGGFVAAWVAKNWQLAVGAIIGGLFLLGGIMNLKSMPHPTWFAVVDVVMYVPCGIVGALLAPRPAATSSAPAAS